MFSDLFSGLLKNSSLNYMTVRCTFFLEGINSDPIVYPNPFTGKFKIQIDSPDFSFVEIEVVNLIGQLVCSKKVSVIPVNQTIELTYNELGQKGNVFIYKILAEGHPVKSGKIMHKQQQIKEV